MLRLFYVLLIFSVLFSGAEFNPGPIKYLAKNVETTIPDKLSLHIDGWQT